MYAVIRTGGKQYRVAADDIVEIEKIAGQPGEMVTFSEVLMIGGNGESQIGTPLIEGASVTAELLEQKRARKIIVFKKKRRKNYRRKKGHRQHLTRLRILEVLGKGQSPSRQPGGNGGVGSKSSPESAGQEASSPENESGQE